MRRFIRWKNKKPAFSLQELTTVLVVIGILAAVAVGRFRRVLEINEAREAVAALRQIWNGQEMFLVEHNFYWPNTGTAATDIDTINHDLRLSLNGSLDRLWDYWVNGDPTTFQAKATRRTGGHKNETVTIDQDGTLGGSWTGEGVD